MIWFDEGTSGSISVVGSGQFLEVMHHFRFPDGWDDEAAATMSVSLISSSGPLLPVSKVFGLGLDNGVENDVEIKSWSILSNNGIRSSADYPYLRAGEVVHMEVQLGFENTTEGKPRSGQTLVRFLSMETSTPPRPCFRTVSLFSLHGSNGAFVHDLGRRGRATPWTERGEFLPTR